jgi:hypothetical protein
VCIPASFLLVTWCADDPFFCSSAADSALASKLAEELKFETENHPEEGAPQFLTDFQALKTWSVSVHSRCLYVESASNVV